MGFTLNQLEQERQIRKLQKKEDKDTKDYDQLSNLPKINNVELKGDKTTSDLGINATNVMMSDGVTSVEDAVDEVSPKIYSGTTLSDLITAIGTIGQDNIDYIVVNAYTLRMQVLNTFVCITAGESSLNFFILRTDLSTFKRLEHSWNSTTATLTDVVVTSWSIHY